MADVFLHGCISSNASGQWSPAHHHRMGEPREEADDSDLGEAPRRRKPAQ
jgi:hypothetical protein